MQIANTSPATGVPSDARFPATEKLSRVVRDLVRASRERDSLGLFWAGLFWGMAAAAAAVGIVRVTGLELEIWIAIVACVGLSLTACVVLERLRRPDDLQVVIRADIKLRLQQKLSTAWEFARAGAEPELTERLSTQATRTRLPARPETIFPLQVNTWGKLTPVAAALLIFASFVDLHWTGEPQAAVVDPLVASEGERLRAFALRMRARAEAEQLPRSADQSSKMRQLGSRMLSGEHSREQALEQLRDLGRDLDEERLAALDGDATIPTGPLKAKRLEHSPAAGSASLRAMLQALLDGRLRPDGVELSDEQRRALEQAGVDESVLKDALDDLSKEEQERLREILDSLSPEDREQRDAEELARARDEVARARDSLGDPDGSVPTDNADGRGDNGAEAAGAEGFEGERTNEHGDDDWDGFTSGGGLGQSLQAGDGGATQSPPTAERGTGPVLKAQGQLREGAVFTSQARVIPRSNKSVTETVELDARYNAQVEQVLSKEDYPAHRKAYVRRYFLNLSEGVPAGRE